MIQQVNASKTINPLSEMHYKFHHKIDPSIFPQVHDFYEMALSTNGKTGVTVNGVLHEAKAGALMLIRPGDVHSRFELSENCEYINLAFPKELLKDMASYIGMPDIQKELLSYPNTLKCTLSRNETNLLRLQLERLNLYPISAPHLAYIELRRLLLNTMLKYFIPLVASLELQDASKPMWLIDLTKRLEDPKMLGASLDDIAGISGYTKEHLCREFKKHLSITPTAYMNSKRLNYAANLLAHSDMRVIDIAYSSGFQSLSRFYHAFKQEFGMSARSYRRSCNIKRTDV